MMTSVDQIEIAFGDCDPAGIVFYPNYFRFFDAATARLFALALGERKPAWTRRFGIVGIPMVKTDAEFLRPSRYGDSVEIATRIERFGRTSFDVRHELRNGGELGVIGRETRVWVARAEDGSLRPVPIPAEVVERLGA